MSDITSIIIQRTYSTSTGPHGNSTATFDIINMGPRWFFAIYQSEFLVFNRETDTGTTTSERGRVKGEEETEHEQSSGE